MIFFINIIYHFKEKTSEEANLIYNTLVLIIIRKYFVQILV